MPDKAGAHGHIKAESIARLRIGIPKEDVLKVFGLPFESSAKGTGEILYYRLEKEWWQTDRIAVKIEGGKAVEFGTEK